MLYFKKITKHFGQNILFKDIDLQISLNDRIGLIGQNGSGKTTLFSLMLGEQSPDTGQIEKNKNMIIGCLKQEVIENLHLPLLDEVTRSLSDISRIKERIELLHEEIANEDDKNRVQNYIDKLGDYQTEFESRGGYDMEHKAKRILFGLGFKEADLNRSVLEFSGGWRMRISLAKLLLQEPDLLLLDEPTNHLDLESVIWIEEFLREYMGSIIIISHDRVFLNNTVTRIIEIDQKILFQYTGNYDDYLIQKKARQEILEASFKNQQKKVQVTERFIEKFRYKATKARQVQSRIKSLEKMERIQLEQKSSKISIKIPSPPRSGKVVINLKNVYKQYGGNVIYNGLNLEITSGDRIALVGPNGAGKSTLLKIMAGAIDIDKGEVQLGYNVSRTYFAQHQLEILNPNNTVLEEIDSCLSPDLSISARSYLGSFLFTEDDVFKKVFVLSGGEKSRLVLAKIILTRPNLLLLDEPTNHLDIPSRVCLQEALAQYTGTICMISHDRDFLNKLTNKIIHIDKGKLEVYAGNYDDFLIRIKKKKEAEMIPSSADSDDKGIKSKNENKEQRIKIRGQKRIEAERRNERYKLLNPLQTESKKVQSKLNSVLNKINHYNTLFADVSYYKQPEFPEKLREYKELEAKNEELTNRWAKLEEQIEAIEKEFSTSI